MLLNKGERVNLKGYLPPDSVEHEAVVLRFSDPGSTTAKIAKADLGLQKRKRQRHIAYKAHRDAGKPDSTFSYDWSGDRQAIRRQIAGARNERLKRYLMLRYFDFHPTAGDSVLARRTLEEVSPTSPLWSLRWSTGGPTRMFEDIARLASQPEKTESYAERIRKEHPDPSIRAGFLYRALAQAHREGNTAKAGRLYTRLKNKYADVPDYGRLAEKKFAPSRAVQTGKQVPSFSVSALSDSVVAYTDETFRGETYLVDVWATWCGPCIGEMEHLHEAYAKYRDEDFTILSVSIDNSVEAVEKFREEQWPMPRPNAFSKGGFDSEAAKTFEVAGVPKVFLVDEKGKIIATERELRGEELLQTLGKVFGEAEPGGETGNQ